MKTATYYCRPESPYGTISYKAWQLHMRHRPGQAADTTVVVAHQDAGDGRCKNCDEQILTQAGGHR